MPHARSARLAPALLAVAALGALGSLLVGVEAGLDRLGVGVAPAGAEGVPHGALMVNGFVGTLISAERARAAGRPAAYLVPVLSALGALLLVAGAQDVARLLFVGAALGLAGLMTWFWRKQPQLPLAVVAVGAVVWAGGGITWIATGNVIRAVPWWGTFLVVTILGERLELARFARRSVRPAQLGIVLALAALIVTTRDLDAGTRAVGAALVVIGAWLLWADTARRTITRGGLATYAGAALLAAYGWLLVAGIMLVRQGLVSPWYDATLHALFVGFVVGSIFAHGPIVFPALSGRGVRLSVLLVLALGLLHLSVGVRVAAGIAGEPDWREVAGALHAVAFALYIGGMAFGVLAYRRGQARVAAHDISMTGSS